MAETPVPDTTYRGFLERMGKLLEAAMPATDASRDRLEEAEADLHRLRKEVVLAEERVEVLSERYRRDRGVFMTMFETWKDEFGKLDEKADPEETAEVAS